MEWIRDQIALIGGFPGVILAAIWVELYMLRRELKAKWRKKES
jgi:hypothetical protein